MQKILITALATMTFAPLAFAQNGLVVTYAEAPKATTSTLADTTIFDFNKLSLGVNKNVIWDGVGVFDQLYIHKPDQYGGAADASNPNGSYYSVQGIGSPVKTSVLTLNEDHGYFGMWWSAGDASNKLSFYNDDKLVAEFTTASLLGALPKSYYGNPLNTSLDAGEPFAFINFFADANTTWDKIVFTNVTTSGFESDNYTDRLYTYSPQTDGANLPGVPVVRVSGTTTVKIEKGATGAALWGSNDAIPGAPEPSLGLLGFLGVAMVLKRRKSSQTEAQA